VIIEIAIGVAVVAAAGGVGALLRRRPPNAPATKPAPTPAFVSGEPSAPRSSRSGARGLRCGDVVTGPGLELVLHAMIELVEEGLVLRAFRTVEVNERWVVQLDPHAKRLALGVPTDEVPRGSIPEALPIGGRMLRLERRGVARARTEGQVQLSSALSTVRYAVLSERAGRVAVVLDPEGGERIALRLDELDIRGIDVLRGGDVQRTE
jgi:hypothetical protein